MFFTLAIVIVVILALFGISVGVLAILGGMICGDASKTVAASYREKL